MFPSICRSLSPTSYLTDVLDGVRGHHEDDGERGEEEEEGRAEEEKFHFGGGGGGDDAVAAATSSSALITNPLPLEASLPTTSTLGPLELTNPGSELTSLGKICG